MALTVGSRLDRYDVTALIGEGGMGQVYCATETQLGRDVGLKIRNCRDSIRLWPSVIFRFLRMGEEWR